MHSLEGMAQGAPGTGGYRFLADGGVLRVAVEQ